MNLNGEAAQLTNEAKQREKDDPDTALSLYDRAWAKICELDGYGKQAQAWRTTQYPVNRMSLILERRGDHDRALQVIEKYLAASDPVGISRSDNEAIHKRQERMKKKAR